MEVNWWQILHQDVFFSNNNVAKIPPEPVV